MVAIEQYRHDRLRMRVVASEPGYLVLSNLWYPGWRATVDDTATDILPANYALQAVPVAAGEHRVTSALSALELLWPAAADAWRAWC